MGHIDLVGVEPALYRLHCSRPYLAPTMILASRSTSPIRNQNSLGFSTEIKVQPGILVLVHVGLPSITLSYQTPIGKYDLLVGSPCENSRVVVRPAVNLGRASWRRVGLAGRAQTAAARRGKRERDGEAARPTRYETPSCPGSPHKAPWRARRSGHIFRSAPASGRSPPRDPAPRACARFRRCDGGP